MKEMIYYEHNQYFKIVPKMDLLESYEFLNYLFKLKLESRAFFWDFDEKLQIIKPEQSNPNVEHDIFIQFVKLSSWIYKRGYYLEGFFYFRQKNTIEYWRCINKKYDIKHMVFFDGINPNYFVYDKHHFLELMMHDVKNKVNNYTKKSWIPKFNNFIRMIGIISVGSLLFYLICVWNF